MRNRSATGFRLIFGLGLPFGRPRCEARIRRAPWRNAYSIVGSVSRIRVSSITRPSSSGTLKSTRMNTRFPAKSRSLMESFDITPPHAHSVPNVRGDFSAAETVYRVPHPAFFWGWDFNWKPETRNQSIAGWPTYSLLGNKWVQFPSPALFRRGGVLLTTDHWQLLQPLAGNVVNQIAHPARVSPLVVVPRDDLHHVAIDDARQPRIDNRRMWIALEVTGDQLFLGIAKVALQPARLRSRLQSSIH